MSAGPVTRRDFQDLLGAHNNLTRDHDDLKAKHNQLTAKNNDLTEKHNLAVRVIDQLGASAEAEALRLNAVVQAQDALNLRQDAQQRLLDRVDRLAERLEASEGERARLADTWQGEKEALTDRINKLEENSTAVTAISSQVNTLMLRLAELEAAHKALIEQKELYAKRLSHAEATIDLQTDIIEDLTRKDDARNSLDNEVHDMSSKVNKIYQILTSDEPAPSSSQMAPSSPSPAAAGQPLSASSSPSGSPIRNPQSPLQQKLARLRSLAHERLQIRVVEPPVLRLVAPHSSALGQPATATGSTDG